MKKTLSLILALLMTLGCASAIFADEPAIADDTVAAVEEATAYDEAITFLVDQQIMKGYDNGELGAADDVERYQMALFIGRISTGWVDDKAWEDGPQNTSEFTDLENTAAKDYLGALSYVNQKGIIEGYGDGRFGPEDNVIYQDVLTMAVRALGYKNLDYPWGYIEKAINLGVTAGVTGVAYTANASRGVVAQVIYNTMFATTKEGDTLALRSFGVEFGWETVIISATDRSVYAAGDKTAPNGTVGFRILNADGTLDENVYYVTAEALGFTTAHADEIALGRPYRVFFELDAAADLVKVNKYVDLYDAENDVWNMGRTNDEGKNVGTYPISSFLNGYTLVSKYGETAGKFTIASDYDKGLAQEIIVKRIIGGDTYLEITSENQKYAINWETGDILVKDGDGYRTEWYWNDKLQTYYDIKTVAGVDGVEIVVGIDYMDEKDAAQLRADYEAHFVIAKQGGGMATLSKISAPAYASLETFDLDGDNTADYAMYEEYKLGYFQATTKQCGTCNAAKSAYKITNVDTLGDKVYKLINGIEDDSFESVAVYDFVEGACAHKGYLWMNPDYTPAQDKIGNYKNGYVIYNYNMYTGEVKVVKNISELGSNDDADSYITTGIVVAYDMDKGTVTVQNDDGTITKLELGYDALLGADFRFLDTPNKKFAERIYADYFYMLINQYVKYMIIDGKLVLMSVEGAQPYSNMIVVEEFAGLSSDGYILVDGYSTSSLKLERYRIASYDGYKQGNYLYNKLTEEEIRNTFEKGTLYKITSYIPGEKAYNVTTVGTWVDNDQEYYSYSVPSSIRTSTINWTFEVCDYGYLTSGSNRFLMSDTDKYIIIGEVGGTYDPSNCPIRVFEGKVTNKNWAIAGDRISVGENTYIIFNLTNLVGFENEYKSGLVLYMPNGSYISGISYEDQAMIDDWYKLGVMSYDQVYMFDIVSGSYTMVSAENVKLKTGMLYKTIDGKIIDKTAFSAYNKSEYGMFKSDMVRILLDYFADQQDGNAKILLNGRLGTASIRSSWDSFGDYRNKHAADGDTYVIPGTIEFFDQHGLYSSNGWSSREYYQRIKGTDITGAYDKGSYVSSTYHWMIESTNGVVTDVRALSSDEWNAMYSASRTDYRYDYVSILNAKSKVNNVYYFADSKVTVDPAPAPEPKPVIAEKGGVADTTTQWKFSADDQMKASIDWTVQTSTLEGVESIISPFKVSTLTFEYTGACANDDHGVVKNDLLYFIENYDPHFSNVELYYALNGGTAKEGHGIFSVTTYDAHDSEETEICGLAKAVNIDVSKIFTDFAAGESATLYIGFKTETGMYNIGVKISVSEANEVSIEFLGSFRVRTYMDYNGWHPVQKTETYSIDQDGVSYRNGVKIG